MSDRQPLLQPQQGGYPPPQPNYQQHPSYPPQQAPPQGGAPPGAPIFKGEVPNEDVHEKNAPGQPQPVPSAPPITSMDQVTGYENTSFRADAFIPPPAYQETAPPQTESSAVQADIPMISEDEAREALLEEVSTHCCYGKGAARQLVFTNITASSAFHYQLETFTEGRKTAWEYEPYAGQLIDGPQNGPAPGPWDIAAQPSQLFQNSQKHFEIPHTASVKVCHGCMGAGVNRCWKCLGRGRVICSNCDGSGHILQPVYHQTHHHHHGHHHHDHHHHGHHGHHGGHIDMESVCCHYCNGSGRKRCSTCNGCGQLECRVCHARGQLKCYIKLTVTWKTTKADHVVERTALPDHLIRDAQGKVAFQDQQPRVAPVTNFPDKAVNDASSELVQSHSIAFPTERIVMQRHWIRIVPVSEVACSWKGQAFNYWVYGYNTRVYDPDYPQQVCWGCTLM